MTEEEIIDAMSCCENIEEIEGIVSDSEGIAKLEDESIDDGCDDDDDEYIMKRLYSVGDTEIRVYYGNNTGIIGAVNENGTFTK